MNVSFKLLQIKEKDFNITYSVTNKKFRKGFNHCFEIYHNGSTKMIRKKKDIKYFCQKFVELMENDDTKMKIEENGFRLYWGIEGIFIVPNNNNNDDKTKDRDKLIVEGSKEIYKPLHFSYLLSKVILKIMNSSSEKEINSIIKNYYKEMTDLWENETEDTVTHIPLLGCEGYFGIYAYLPHNTLKPSIEFEDSVSGKLYRYDDMSIVSTFLESLADFNDLYEDDIKKYGFLIKVSENRIDCSVAYKSIISQYTDSSNLYILNQSKYKKYGDEISDIEWRLDRESVKAFSRVLYKLNKSLYIDENCKRLLISILDLLEYYGDESVKLEKMKKGSDNI